MNGSGEFTTTLDLGVLGEQTVEVYWRGYRPHHQTVDDQPDMSITSVLLGDSPGDFLSWLAQSTITDLELEAWEHFPLRGHLAAFRQEG